MTMGSVNASVEDNIDLNTEHPKILFTGYKPWSGSNDSESNITQTVLEELQEESQGKGYDIEILDVTYGAVDNFVRDTPLTDYDVIINLGENPLDDAKPVRFEAQANNREFMMDDDGDCPLPVSGEETCLSEGRDETKYFASRDILQIGLKDEFSKHAVEIAGNSGNYLCEYLHFEVMEATQESKTQTAFIHLGKEAGAEHHVAFLKDLVEQIESQDFAQKLENPTQKPDPFVIGN